MKQMKTIIEPTELFTTQCDVIEAHEVAKIKSDPINKNLAVMVLDPFSKSAKIMKHEVIAHL